MKIQPQQLSQYLTNNKIAPLYLLTGDEFLLIQETRDAIYKHAKLVGYNNKETFYLEPGFNWNNFLTSINNLSLFNEKTLIELHLKNKITEIGSKILQNYALKPAIDKIVVIISGKLDSSQQKSAWFHAIDTHGVIVQIWPIDVHQLPQWIATRLKQAGLKTDNHGINLLINYTCGNPLAAMQEIEKLKLLYGCGNLSIEQITQAITDNTRFNIFNLLDNALCGKTSIISKILENLKLEGVEPTIILWSLTQQLRTLININHAISQGIEIEQVMRQNNIWGNRKIIIKRAITKISLLVLQNLLKKAAQIDSIIKGANSYNLLWHELNKIYLNISNKTTSQ